MRYIKCTLQHLEHIQVSTLMNNKCGVFKIMYIIYIYIYVYIHECEPKKKFSKPVYPKIFLQQYTVWVSDFLRTMKSICKLSVQKEPG